MKSLHGGADNLLRMLRYFSNLLIDDEFTSSGLSNRNIFEGNDRTTAKWTKIYKSGLPIFVTLLRIPESGRSDIALKIRTREDPVSHQIFHETYLHTLILPSAVSKHNWIRFSTR